MTHKMPSLMLRYTRWFTGTFQACLIVSSLVLAWLLRFDFTLPYRAVLLLAIPILLVARLLPMAYFGLFRGWWRYVGVKDGLDIVKAVTMGSLFFWTTMRLGLRTTAFP